MYDSGATRPDAYPARTEMQVAARVTTGQRDVVMMVPEVRTTLPSSQGTNSITEEQHMIEVTGITKRYGDTLAVDDLSFEVKPGQITGFLGPNGSGKSTTMRMIMGLDNPDAGEAKINGGRLRRSRLAASRGRAHSSRPRRSIPAEAPSIIFGRWPRPTTFRDHEWTRSSRSWGSRSVATQARRHLLTRDGPAARHRGGTSRRPQRAAVRRAHQRSRPRRDPLGPQPAEGTGSRRAGRSSSRATS